MHRGPGPQIAEHLFDRATLRIGRLERQCIEKTINKFAVGIVGDAHRGGFKFAFATDEGDLDTKQFVVDQPATSKLNLFERFGHVDVEQCCGPIDETMSLEQLPRHRVSQTALSASAQRLANRR